MSNAGINTSVSVIRRVIAVIHLAVVISVPFSCVSTFLYHPTRELRGTPGDEELPYQDVYFQNSLGNRLHGWWVPSKGAKYTILLCHGNGGNISHRTGQVDALNRHGFNVFIFDYAGYGLSEGSPSEQGLYDDAMHAWGHLITVKKTPPGDVIIWGTSLGGSVAAMTAAKTGPRALVLESSFYSLKDVADHLFPFYPSGLCIGDAFSTYRYVQTANCPVMVIHSRDDETVPYVQGVRLFDSAGPPKKFLEIQGSHNKGFSLARERICRELIEFLSMSESR